MPFHCITNIYLDLAQERGYEINNFGITFLSPYYYRLSCLCPGVEKKIYKDMMHFLYMRTLKHTHFNLSVLKSRLEDLLSLYPTVNTH